MVNENINAQLQSMYAEVNNLISTAQSIQSRIVNLICENRNNPGLTSSEKESDVDFDRLEKDYARMRHVQITSGIDQRNPEIVKDSKKNLIHTQNDQVRKKDTRIINKIMIEDISTVMQNLVDRLPRFCTFDDIRKVIYGYGGASGSYESYVRMVCTPDITFDEWENIGYGVSNGRRSKEDARLRFTHALIGKRGFKQFIEDTNYTKRLVEEGYARSFNEHGTEVSYVRDVLVKSFDKQYEDNVQKLISGLYKPESKEK
mgnify:CR=1 FL=1